jgi:5-oxoprolinase (ATP-hydrolysing) subunit A
MLQKIDINCDMGEGMATDAMIMPYISSANIACGYHAGDADIIKRTIELCLQNNVAAGAHPSFLDKGNFGRKEQYWDDEMLYNLVSEQLYIFEKIAFPLGCIMHHVKPHGALYNMAAKDKWLSRIMVKAIRDFDEHLLVYGLSGSHIISEAEEIGLKAVNEVFADRTYQHDGSLTPRSQTDALITDDEKSVKQVLQMLQHKTVTTQSGITFPIQAETICIHGDGVHAVTFTKSIYEQLKAHHIAIETI